MITTLQKQEIAARLEQERSALGSWAKVAAKVGANVATVSRNMQQAEYWANVSEKMWTNVAAALDYTFADHDWQIVPTTHNARIMNRLLNEAQQQSQFFAISFPAEQGKSAGAEAYVKANRGSAFYIRIKKDWSHKRFVQELAGRMGVKVEGLTVSDMIDEIVYFLKRKTAETRPLLVIDEAADMRPTSFLLIKTLFNELEDEVGLVIIGTEALKQKIERGVRCNVVGYDEIESRLGRSYHQLFGLTRDDVQAVCAANGVESPDDQARIWEDMRPTQKFIQGKPYEVSSDKMGYRRLKRLVQREVSAIARKRSAILAPVLA